MKNTEHKDGIDLALPTENYASPQMMTEGPKEKHYPRLTLDGSESLDLPDAGVITFRFKKVEHTVRKTSDGERHSCTLEVMKLIDTEADAKKDDSDDNSGRALDTLRKKRAEKEEEY